MEVLDQTLNSVNDGLHRILENKMRDEPLVLKKKARKRVFKKVQDQAVKDKKIHSLNIFYTFNFQLNHNVKYNISQ